MNENTENRFKDLLAKWSQSEELLKTNQHNFDEVMNELQVDEDTARELIKKCISSGVIEGDGSYGEYFKMPDPSKL